MRTHAEWNVDTHILRATGPTSASTRVFISSAALLVKVIARISNGEIPCSWMSQAMRCVSTRVLPEPAPATMSSGPPGCVTASRWTGFRSSSSPAGTAISGATLPAPYDTNAVAARRCSRRKPARDALSTGSSATFRMAPCGNAEDVSEMMFAPDSVTWQVHADPSMLIGGMRALLVQALHPLAMAGVEQHSDYRADPWGRLQRTAEYVMTTTYGTEEEARQAGRVVQAIHKRVRGTDPVTGKTYSAEDPDLLVWVHAVEVHSFLMAYRRYGAGRCTDDDADQYVAEQVGTASLVGLDPALVPASVAALRDYFQSVDDE